MADGVYRVTEIGGVVIYRGDGGHRGRRQLGLLRHSVIWIGSRSPTSVVTSRTMPSRTIR